MASIAIINRVNERAAFFISFGPEAKERRPSRLLQSRVMFHTMGLMKLNRAAGILALFLIIQLLAACSGASSNSSNSGPAAAAPNTDNSNSARTNVEELGILVNMPFETEETVWKEYPS